MPASPLQILLLIKLESGPKYGYEMLKDLKDEFDGIWEPKTGTVYPALKSLEKKGFVKTKDKMEKDYYIITEEGKAVFKQMLGFLEISSKFSTKYMTVVFKWMSKEMKKGFLNLINTISHDENRLTDHIMNQIYEDLDDDVKEPFLKNMRTVMKQRLDTIDVLLEKIEENGK
jgi:DNA-binding PadR family transcriptional regulator